MKQISSAPPKVGLDFPIVGIGASAGGLEAILEVLESLPASANLAVLVVQHLNPSRPSLLAEIFSSRTSLHVSEAEDGLVIKSGCLYVIPPKMSMEVETDRIKLSPRDETISSPTPINDLFQSMALCMTDRAIGVILSGSGTDGALGMQAIKENGGITFAQDVASARFGSMPQAAIQLACIDFVLKPAAIAKELMRIAQHPLAVAAHPDRSDRASDEESYARLFRRLQEVCNIDFSYYKRGTIERRLTRRLVLHDLRTLSDYVTLLEGDQIEARALCREFLINFTHFFRDVETFDTLFKIGFPRILQNSDAQAPIRVWVAGCSTGEEVYSLAICLTEYLTRASLSREIQIFGTDISEEALDIARTGRYPENIARDVSAERLQRFFVKEGDHFRVSKVIRDSCIFARQNVAYDPPLSRLDLLSCRNLLIYLEPSLQKKVMPLFHFSLRTEGLLLLGMSETIGAYSDLFTMIENSRGSKLFAKKWLPGRLYPAFPASPASADKARSPLAVRPAYEGSMDTTYAEQMRREVDNLALARYAPTSVLCDENFKILEFRGDTGMFLVNPTGPPTNDLRRLAKPDIFFAVSDAIREVQKTGNATGKRGFSLGKGNARREFSLEVLPIRLSKSEENWFLFFFQNIESSLPKTTSPSTQAGKSVWGWARDMIMFPAARSSLHQKNHQQEQEITRQSDELRATREQITLMLAEHERALDELKSIEEETLSSNEEFQSANEELETAKEELQSLNEELSTTNDELRYRNSELKALHEVISQSRDYSDAIVETMAEPMLILDANFKIERANRAFYKVFQTRPSETLHTNLYALGNGQWDIPLLRDLLEELLPRHTEVRDHEVTAYFPRLGRRTMLLNAVRIAWPDQGLILLTIDDVTARHEVLERLIHGDRQKDEFLAMLAHELRNPLAAMKNALQLLKRTDAGIAVKEKAQAILERQLHKQIRLVDELLDVSRISRGVVSLKLERFDLTELIRMALETLQVEIAVAGHQVTLDFPSEPLFVNADKERLEQVVTNLVVNAIKYTLQNGNITLTLHHDLKDAIFTVSDNGIGMTQEFLARVFTVFAQADTSFEKTHGGLGIGLALVRRIAELHGGSIHADSLGLGLGSSFSLRIPALSNAELEQDSASDAKLLVLPAAHMREKHRILVVDDNLDAAESLASVLKLDGHQTQVVFDATKSFEAVEHFKPDVVLLDIGMPGIDGYEVCRRMRRMPGHEGMTLIAISGYGTEKNIETAKQAGFDHHMTKPADLQQLAGYLKSKV